MGKGKSKRKGSKGESGASSGGIDGDVVPATMRDNSPPWPYEGQVTVHGRFVEKGDPEYEDLLAGPYEGLVVDPPSAVHDQMHTRVKNALDAMDEAGLFQQDVTQPFGLGTKLAPTFVTRCLVGAPGTTYRYLGMRMFAHPMHGGVDLANGVRGVEDPARREKLRQALHDMGQFNRDMIRRGQQHLRRLSGLRKQAGMDEAVGSARFNVLLINRMAPSGDAERALKPEPTFQKDLCSVSWHADSSLEHFSTIGVYHLTPGSDEPAAPADARRADWRVAVRVAHDAEGPGAGKLTSASSGGLDGAVQHDTPPLALALPSRSTYFMLDSWNHHHQHAVLAGSDGMRFSSTHRVLRPGHTFAEIDERCRSVLGDMHRRGQKVWRAEQLMLNELEFEWVRQFYVQGEAHRRALGWWREPMRKLLSHMARLETRTHQVLTMLRMAAEHAIAPPPATTAPGAPVDRRARKAQDKRRKAAEAVRKLGDRAGATCEMMAELLEERAEKRRLWADREADKAFQRMPEDRRPLPLPLVFGRAGAQGEEDAAGRFMSPLPHDLAPLAKEVRRWGPILDAAVSGEGSAAAGRRLPRRSALDSDPAWADEPRIGLEVQEPFCGMLLSGSKPVETRAYALPAELVGRPIELVRSVEGKAGVSGVPDAVPAGDASLHVVGRVTFSSCDRYETAEAWRADADKHRVPADSPYKWTEAKPIYAWRVQEVAVAPSPLPVPSMRRLYRSLFRMCADPEPASAPVSGNGTDRRRGRKRRSDHGDESTAGGGPDESEGKRGDTKRRRSGGGGGGKRRRKGRF